MRNALVVLQHKTVKQHQPKCWATSVMSRLPVFPVYLWRLCQDTSAKLESVCHKNVFHSFLFLVTWGYLPWSAVLYSMRYWVTTPRLCSEDNGCHFTLMSVREVLAIYSWGGALGTKRRNKRTDWVFWCIFETCPTDLNGYWTADTVVLLRFKWCH